jgi:hypothetical protein
MNAQGEIQKNRMALSAVAKRLVETPLVRKSKRSGRSELLELLRSGQLTARISFPSNQSPTFQVSTRYWIEITEGTFQADMVLKTAEGRHAEHLIPAKKFISNYAEWFLSHGSSDRSELESAMARVGKRLEPYILEEEWDQLLETMPNLRERQVSSDVRRSAGVSESVKWGSILVSVAAIMSLEDLTDREVAKRALEDVGTDAGLTKVETVAKKVAEIRKKQTKLSGYKPS